MTGESGPKKNALNAKLNYPLGTLMILCCLFTVTGCLEAVSAFATGAVATAEYVLTGAETRTVCHELDLTKKAVLVTLCRMEIAVDYAQETADGEEILARAGNLEIRVALKLITPTVTHLSVRAEENLLNRDKATAREIIRQTVDMAEKLAAGPGVKKSAQL